MDIFEPNLSSAAYLLKQDMAQRGVELQHTEALDIAARMRGYQSYQVYAAHEKQKNEAEPPVLRQETQGGVGTDYQYVGEAPGGIWIRVRNIDVHVICRQDGVEVELLTAGMADQETNISTSYAYADAAADFLTQSAHIDMSCEARRIVREEGYAVEQLESGRFGVKAKHLKGIKTPTFETEEEALLACYAHHFSEEPVLTMDDSDRYETVGKTLTSDQVLLTLKVEDLRSDRSKYDAISRQYIIPPFTYARVSKTKIRSGAYAVVFTGGCSMVMTIEELQDPTRFRVVKDLHSDVGVVLR